MSPPHTVIDWERGARTGVPEVVFAQSKTVEQLRAIVEAHHERGRALLMTRLTAPQIAALADLPLDIDPLARTATLAAPEVPSGAPRLGIVTAGTSDLPVAREALHAARFLGLDAVLYEDLGVAGLWRLQDRLDEIAGFPLLIAVAGMEAALFSVLAGLVRAPVIAVPTSVGYGVSEGGKAALSSALASCAPGIVTVNIDNGFGAAAAARKFLPAPG
ncbi:nickel pincer cofactor biosynthesis protein LarB [Limimaricola litoreus]